MRQMHTSPAIQADLCLDLMSGRVERHAMLGAGLRVATDGNPFFKRRGPSAKPTRRAASRRTARSGARRWLRGRLPACR